MVSWAERWAGRQGTGVLAPSPLVTLALQGIRSSQLLRVLCLGALCASHLCSPPGRSELSFHRGETGAESSVSCLSWLATKWVGI